jgi:hippurate hydrolase
MSIDVEALYRQLHRHPELSFQEHQTAETLAAHLTALGCEVTTGIGGTGIVGILRNGAGPVVAVRADMDALPIRELTGLPYASAQVGQERDGTTVPVMHACGHDVHMACLIGAMQRLVAEKSNWTGTVVAVLQPAEERYGGAQAMVDDGLASRMPRPDVVLAQHVDPLPAGWIGIRPGAMAASADTLTVTLRGVGGHASRPETTVDPILMAAATTLRLQGIVSRELAAGDAAVVTVGSLHAGTTSNTIAGEAVLGISVRAFDESVRATVLGAIERIVRAEATASGTPHPPEIRIASSLPVTWNDLGATERAAQALDRVVRAGRLVDPGPDPGSEDVGVLAAGLGAPLVFWLLGGTDPTAFDGGYRGGRTPDHIATNHSPTYAPTIRPTLQIGIDALVETAYAWVRSGPSATALN